MPIRVLIVLDHDFRFNDPAATPDFTFKTLADTLSAAGFQVTKAHRQTDATADIQNIDFTTANLLQNYDAIWLMGRGGRNEFPPSSTSSTIMPGPQIDALAQFMDAGGGVFATGDHDSIGAEMCGNIPRVRVMRSWFGAGDGAKPAAIADVPANFPVITPDRADTTRPNPMGVYTDHAPPPFLWFQNQSDSLPQPITPSSTPAHPILRRNGADIVVYPDHMHEGKTHGSVGGHDYTQNSPFGDTGKPEFREVAGFRKLPEVIATSQVPGGRAVFDVDGAAVDTTAATPNSINTLSVYDGRVAGVGRIVTGSTFHHYIDINLTGDSEVTPGAISTEVGPNAEKGHGYNDNAAVFDQIKAVYTNITTWMARPRPAISLILERSTFSQDEVSATPGGEFEGAILLTVDGLKPTQFPSGGIPALGPISGTPAWVPSIAVSGGAPITIEPRSVSSDDPATPPNDRLQRFTFTYRVHFTGDAFSGFSGTSSNVPVTATLTSTGVPGTLNDSGVMVLVKSANPFMLDLTDGNNTTWLSSDVKVFHVVEGDTFNGFPLAAPADRAAALSYINNVAAHIDSLTFSALESLEDTSSLSPYPKTIGMPPKNVYNFALARVRLSGAGVDAPGTRVFFRIFRSPTTASITYHLDGSGNPIDAYLKTAGADPIALPGTQSGGTEWSSFPMFGEGRVSPPSSQHDTHNVQLVEKSVGFKIFGALLDTNLDGGYLPAMPGGGALQTVPDLLMNEHQCIVAQIEYPTTPIPDGATPWTSDKLSQRNIAYNAVANPGLDASRASVHTFEIEATPSPISESLPPDELLLDWSARTPLGTMLRIHIPSWNAGDVVDLADRLYPRHEIVVIDDHTIEVPGGGTRYVPIPLSHSRQTGVMSIDLPPGIRKGQRFDVSVRQITNRIRAGKVSRPKVQKITREEAATLVAAIPGAAGRGAVNLGGNKVLYTDLSVFDRVSDHALIIEHPDPEEVKAAIRDTSSWREPVGGFQLAAPVSTRGEMLLPHMRLLSVMRWRTGRLPRESRWRKTMQYYVDLLTEKVLALGGNPYTIPATPDGNIPQLTGDGDRGSGVGLTASADGTADGTPDDTTDGFFKGLLSQPVTCGLVVIIVVLVLILLLLLWRV
jgi:hypothetical protein